MKNKLYNLIIDDLTDHCYRNCLSYFPNYATILDVGIGNGVMLKNYHKLIKAKNLKIIGIDINRSYINHCDRLIRSFQLEDHVQVCGQSIEAYCPPKNNSFDFILFSMSFMLFANQKLVLDKVKDYLKPEGEIIFFQTMYKQRFGLVEFIKPRLKYLTTVDFGRVTYEREFYELLHEKELSVSQDRMIKKEWFKGEYRMIIASSQNGKMNKGREMTTPCYTANDSRCNVRGISW